MFEKHNRVGLTPNIERFAQPAHRAADNRAELALMRRLLRQGVGSCLTRRQQQMVELYYYEHLTMTQIARKLGLSTSTVSRHLKAARGRLANFTRQMQLFKQMLGS